MSITVTVNNQKFTFDKGATYHDIYEKVKENYKYPAMVGRVGNFLREMGMKAKDGEDISFLDYTNEDAAIVYKRGVSFVMVKAVRDVLGEDAEVHIEHSIKKNYYCEIIKDGLESDTKTIESI